MLGKGGGGDRPSQIGLGRHVGKRIHITRIQLYLIDTIRGSVKVFL